MLLLEIFLIFQLLIINFFIIRNYFLINYFLNNYFKFSFLINFNLKKIDFTTNIIIIEFFFFYYRTINFCFINLVDLNLNR